MKRAHDPRRLDVAALAREGGRVQGRWPGSELPRWAASQTPPADQALPDLVWVAEAQSAAAHPEPRLWLQLRCDASAWLTCQRCLQPFQQPLQVDNRLRFVRGEAEAEALDAESEEDVLALKPRLDVRELLEDELLLALPLVPRHERCPQPLAAPQEDRSAAVAGEAEAERPHPFAALAQLRRGG